MAGKFECRESRRNRQRQSSSTSRTWGSDITSRTSLRHIRDELARDCSPSDNDNIGDDHNDLDDVSLLERTASSLALADGIAPVGVDVVNTSENGGKTVKKMKWHETKGRQRRENGGKDGEKKSTGGSKSQKIFPVENIPGASNDNDNEENNDEKGDLNDNESDSIYSNDGGGGGNGDNDHTKGHKNSIEEITSFPHHVPPTVPIYIILPQGNFRSGWDIYIGLLLIYVATFVPFRVSYLGELTGFLNKLEIAIDSSFGMDMILNFLTAYETSAGVLIVSLPKIAVKYLKGSFVLDFVATFPFDRVFEQMIREDTVSGVNQASKLTRLPRVIKIIRIARLLKFLRVYRLQKVIREIEQNYNVHQGVSRLLNVVVIIFFATHLVGCMWHAIGVELDLERAASTCSYDDFLGVYYSGMKNDGG
eukprot:CAMPEP_0172505224 /NCGR_PEP_ID=MMETSP1066-20121228/184569_1 /TAXON_ID=671091 /ORGANISM="Coscinodiscus wailesii, Strain CCMP2513" /LENGTH=420 /DNA_ID=CAMNT_0013281745 /DNA_START=211 /DNA_END=1470 /DNA_ORIENTATION=-